MEIRRDVDLIPIINLALIIVLILLVISPYLSQSPIKINLPKARSTTLKQQRRIIIGISRTGKIFIDEKVIDKRLIKNQLESRLKIDPFSVIVVKSDKDIYYKELEQILDIIRQCKVKNIAIATEIK